MNKTISFLGTGWDGVSATSLLQDFWEYDPVTDSWTQRANFGGAPRCESAAFVIGNFGFIGAGTTLFGNGSSADFWAYNPNANLWTPIANFSGGIREYPIGISIGSKGYFGTGFINDNQSTKFNDFWEYTPDSTHSLSEVENNLRLALYPNPISTQTVLQVNIVLKNATLIMNDCLGQTVKEIKDIYGQAIVLHRDNLPSGTYFLRLKQDHKIIATAKLIITD